MSFHSVDSLTLEEGAQRGCGVPVLGEAQHLAKLSHCQPSLVGSAVTRRLEWMISVALCLPKSLRDPIL